MASPSSLYTVGNSMGPASFRFSRSLQQLPQSQAITSCPSLFLRLWDELKITTGVLAFSVLSLNPVPVLTRSTRLIICLDDHAVHARLYYANLGAYRKSLLTVQCSSCAILPSGPAAPCESGRDFRNSPRTWLVRADDFVRQVQNLIPARCPRGKCLPLRDSDSRFPNSRLDI
jgi:hypothetical protein